MQAPGKLLAQQRKAAIVAAARRVFAAKGFAGTTTRELAAAAGVSEALLYRHFASKEELYLAIRQSFIDERQPQFFQRLIALESSSATLVLLVHAMVTMVARDAVDTGEGSIPCRLMLRSLAEDGEFAQLMHKHLAADWSRKVIDCLRAAVLSGEAVESPVTGVLGSRFAFHLATMASAHFLPAEQVCPGPSALELVRPIVWYALRGMGLTEDAIGRYYIPEVLAVLGSDYRWTGK